jgi:hypothetical protein
MNFAAIAIQTSKSLLLDIIETDNPMKMAEAVIADLDLGQDEVIIELICLKHGGDRTLEQEVEEAIYTIAPQLFSTGYEWSEPR